MLKNQHAGGSTAQIVGTVPRLPVPILPPGGSLGIPKILSTGATLHLVPIRLLVENWECRALKSSARCQKFGVPCRFFLARACKWRFRCSKILGEAGKQEMLQQMFRKF